MTNQSAEDARVWCPDVGSCVREGKGVVTDVFERKHLQVMG